MAHSFKIIFHGGACCGFKHICHLPFTPSVFVPLKHKTKKLGNEGLGYCTSQRNFHTPAAPAETAGERFDRYLAYLDGKRPYGISEVILNQYQLAYWRSFIEERGFVKVSECLNSNSNGRIYVYHRVKDKPKPA